MQSLVTAPPGSLVLNRAAFDIATAHGFAGIELLRREDQLYAFQWQTGESAAAEDAAGEDGESEPPDPQENGDTETDSAADDVDPKTLESTL